ncbi:SMC-Scp complex subunit ScpB [Fructilactobacillus florum]|uniref:Segregation and condensation protein B n=1 Tax=Fructilactobacillus florum DSM 22689 = JCM 16035 TaxID=1423745 RepID=A0A0R2CJQ0_9LACO|nr:SMC-Scp complex subunit ScpB [Fructilactobacillus florum]KRM91440.1 segregation and condensation protein B [Fructilactobacillus florum DSM 22689 = JCM 16035]
MNLLAQIEALVYISANQGITIQKLAELTNVPVAAIRENVKKLQSTYEKRNGALVIVRHGDLIQIATKPEFDKLLQSFTETNEPLLSKPALEVLTIVAYRQPITRIQLDQLRGVNSAVSLRNLQSYSLITVSGHADEPGNPAQYATTDQFLQAFGLQSLADLPAIRAKPQPVSGDLFHPKQINKGAKTSE